MLISTEKVLAEVGQERERQQEKWGEQNHDIALWAAILGEEVGEVHKEIVEIKATALPSIIHADRETILGFNEALSKRRQHIQNYRAELIQVAVVAVQMVECLDRNSV